MNISKSTAPVAAVGEKVRGSRLIARLITLLAVAAACLGLFAGAASADQFSPFPGVGVHTYYNQFADTCWFAVGPVYDQGGTSTSFAVIGGITVQNCSRKHSFEADVYEEYAYSPSGPWYSVAGSEHQTWLPNVYGFGTCSSGCPSGRILETLHICGGSPLYYATVGTVDEYDANGNFIRRVQHVSDVPTKAVQAKPQPC
jgi:hypothetical protein